MKRNLIVLLAGALSGAAAFAQAPATSAPATQTAEDEVVVLSPFEVRSAQDSGWVATNSVAGTKVAMPLSDLPLTINVVTSEFMQDIGATNLMEAMRFTTGITQAPTGIQGVGASNNSIDSFSIRGQGVRYVYRDGVRRWRSHESAFMDRAEVIKGPTAVLYGEALPGGTINYVTKTPSFKSGGYIMARYDEHGSYRAEFDATAPLGESKMIAFRVVGVLEEGDTWRDFETRKHRPLMASLLFQPTEKTRIVVTGESTHSDLENYQANGSAAWRGPNNQGGTNWNGSIGQPIGMHPLATPATTPYGFPVLGNYLDIDTEALTLRLEQNLAKGLDLRVVYNYVDSDAAGMSSGNNDVNVIDSALFNADRTAVQAAPGDTVTVGGRPYVVGRGSTLAGNPIANATPGAYQSGVQRVAVYRSADGYGPLRFVGNSLAAPGLFNPNQIGPRPMSLGRNANIDDTWQFDLTYAFDVANTRQRFTAGYERVRSRFVNWATVDAQSWVRNPDGTAIAGSDRNFYGVGHDMERNIPVDIFGNEWTKSAPVNNALNGATSTQLGQQDAYYANYVGSYLDQRLHVLAGFRSSDIATQSPGQAWQEFSETVPQYGVLFKATEAIAVYASKSESFLLTNARFPSVPPASSNPDAYVPNELFPPQTGKGLDIGLKFDLREQKLSGNLTYFEIERDQIPIVDAEIFDSNGNNVFYPSGTEKNKGVELELFYRPMEALQITAGATYVDSQFVKMNRGEDYLIGQQLFGVPEWLFSAFAKYTFQNGALKGSYIGGGASYQDELQINPGRPFTNDSWVMFDLIAGYRHKIGEYDVTWALTINNLTDEEAYNGFTGGLAPRTASVSMRLTF
jgi:outer membrane receptor protein involved in Fe transport